MIVTISLDVLIIWDDSIVLLDSRIESDDTKNSFCCSSTSITHATSTT